MNSRDDFTKKVKNTLATRVSNFCSNPSCGVMTRGPHTDLSKELSLGKAAHIKAASKGGARYDSKQTSEERRSIENGIWLCANCADLIDYDEINYPSELLHTWKSKREQEVRAFLDAGARITNVSAELYVKATSLLEEARDHLSGYTNAIRTTWHAIADHDIEGARRKIQQAIKLVPNHSELPLTEIIHLIALGLYKKALSMINEHYQENEVSFGQLKMHCLFMLDRSREIIPIIESLEASLVDLPPTVFYNAGLAHLRLGSKRAEEYFEKAIRKDPKYAAAYIYLAQISFSNKDFQKAIDYSEIAIILEPSRDDYHAKHLLSLLEAGCIDEALSKAKNLINLFPISSDIWHYYGRSIGQLGHLEKSEVALRKSITINKNNYEAWSSLLMCVGLQGDKAKLLQIISDAGEADFPDIESLSRIKNEIEKV